MFGGKHKKRAGVSVKINRVRVDYCLESIGAFYHVITRSNRRQKIFRGDAPAENNNKTNLKQGDMSYMLQAQSYLQYPPWTAQHFLLIQKVIFPCARKTFGGHFWRTIIIIGIIYYIVYEVSRIA